jgi:hypothetical protein
MPYRKLYYATEDGQVFSIKRNLPLKSQNRFGYRQLTLCMNNKKKSYLVHRIVLAYFTNMPLDYNFIVNHKNGIKNDNRLENLEWCTYSENSKHAFKLGLSKISNYNKLRVQQTHGKIVIDLNNGIFYNSIREAAYYNNIPEGTLRKKILGTRTNNTNFIKV